jgi:hypothetical protein
MLRRGRFADLIRRQLDLFETAEATLLEEAADANNAWTNAGADESEELYGDYQLVVDTIGERLYDLRETYASSLGETAVDDYRESFNRAAVKRFRSYSAFLEDES